MRLCLLHHYEECVQLSGYVEELTHLREEGVIYGVRRGGGGGGGGGRGGRGVSGWLSVYILQLQLTGNVAI